LTRITGFIVLLCLSAALTGVRAQADDAGVHEYRLDNGLKLLVKEDHRAPVVVTQVWYRIGSSYEEDGHTGISHALEHMMFKGTKKHGEGEFSRIIAENGGNENAFTSDDYTVYFQTLENTRLPVSFELEADRMRNLSLKKEAFTKEIEVVKEERRMRTDDNPGAYTYETAMATAFQTSPYRNPTIGWMADLKHMRVQDLRRWYHKWYAPDNATLVVAGDVQPLQVLALAKKYFGPLKPEKITPPPSRPEVEQTGIKRVVVRRPAEVPEIIMAWKVPVLTTARRPGSDVAEWEPYALDVLAGILSGGDSARFNSQLVRGREVASSLDASYDLTSRLDSVFVVSGEPARGKTAADLEAAVRDQIASLKSEPVSDEELQRVKAQVVSSDVYQRDSVFYQALILGTLESVGLSWQDADKYVDRVKAVTAAQVQQVAAKYFTDRRLTVAQLDPLPMHGKPQRTITGGMNHVR
jgi:zinc protease